MSLLDHVTLVVSDYARSKAFYEKALAPLGVKVIMEYGTAAASVGTRSPISGSARAPRASRRQSN
jgi:catechol 2,3-dioxygenase-like lactoylglutathione lyase family enzyme